MVSLRHLGLFGLALCQVSQAIDPTPPDDIPPEAPALEQLGPQGPPLDVPTLQNALGAVASYLHEEGENINIVAVGGAVSTLYLGSRNITYDIDFFMKTARDPLHADLRRATLYARKKLWKSIQLGPKWIENTASFFINEQLQRDLFDAAVLQNTVVFQQPGLKIWAAPWDFAFAGKVQRLCRGTYVKPYDLSDSVDYLRQHLWEQGRSSVSRVEVEEMGRMFGKKMPEDRLDLVLGWVNELYASTYGVAQVITEPSPSESTQAPATVPEPTTLITFASETATPSTTTVREATQDQATIATTTKVLVITTA